MSFKIGEKLKLKSNVTDLMIHSIGVGRCVNDDIFQHAVKVSNVVYNHYSIQDMEVKLGLYKYPYIMPEEWFEQRKRPGHHLTKIFK